MSRLYNLEVCFPVDQLNFSPYGFPQKVCLRESTWKGIIKYVDANFQALPKRFDVFAVEHVSHLSKSLMDVASVSNL